MTSARDEDDEAQADPYAGSWDAAHDRSSYDPGGTHSLGVDQDTTGPIVAAGFGAWQATMADAQGDGTVERRPAAERQKAGDTGARRTGASGAGVPAARTPSMTVPPATTTVPSATTSSATTPSTTPSMTEGLAALDLLDTLAEVVFRTDAEGRWTYLNPAWTRLTGFGIAESLGNRFIEYVHPDELEHTIALFMAVVVGGADHCHHETRYRIAGGVYRRVQIRAKVLRDDAGEVVGNIGTIIDVTDARFGAEMAGEQGALLELVPTGGKIDDLPVGVVIYEPDLTVLRVSQVVDRLVGAQTRAGDRVDVLSDQLRPAAPGGPALGGEWGLVATARRTRQAQIGDLDVVPAQVGGAPAGADPGTAGWPPTRVTKAAPAVPLRSLRATVIPLHDDDDTRVGVVFADITDLRRAERQQAALAYLGQRALTTLDVPALLSEAVELVATTLAVERCDLIECVEVTSSASTQQARRAAFGEASGRVGAEPGGVAVARAHADGGRPAEVQARVRTCSGRVGGAWAAGPVSAAPGSFVSAVLSSGQPLVIEDLGSHPEIAAEGWLHGDGAVATVGAAIGVGSRAFGVLAAHSTARRWFARDDAHFLQSVANVIAAAVELAQVQEDRARLAVFEDRDRIACELHDLVIQRLFSVGLRLQSLVRLVAEPGTDRLSTAISDLDQTIDDVRRTIFDLRPPYA